MGPKINTKLHSGLSSVKGRLDDGDIGAEIYCLPDFL